MEVMQKYFYDVEGRLHMKFIATPFGGVINGQDFKGTHFSERTDFGPLDKALSYLDHNNFALHHPQFKSLPGITDGLGVASRVGLSKNEELIYDVIVNESYQYKEMLKALADAGALDYASTTPYQKSYQYDPATGEILKYEIIEVGPTWKPAHPGAANISATEEIVKSIIMKELEMAEKVEDAKVVTTPSPEVKPEPVVSETPITDAVNALLEVEGETEKSMPQLMVEVLAEIKALRAENAELKTAQVNQEKSIKDLSVAFPKMAEVIAKNFKAAITDDKQRSTVEKSVVKTFAAEHGRNSNAPGRDRKASFAQNNT